MMFTLMVRSASLRVSNDEAEHAAILRDARKSALLRMRTGSTQIKRSIRCRIAGPMADFRFSEISLDGGGKSVH